MKVELDGILLNDTQEQADGGILEGRSITSVNATDGRNMVMISVPGMEGSVTLLIDTKGAASLSNSAGFKLDVNNAGNVKISLPGTVDIEGTVVNIKGSAAVNIN